jgi:hypothetical protein
MKKLLRFQVDRYIVVVVIIIIFCYYCHYYERDMRLQVWCGFAHVQCNMRLNGTK